MVAARSTGHQRYFVKATIDFEAFNELVGNIRIGEGSKVGSGSVVLCDVPPHTTVAGVPAKVVGTPAVEQPALAMNQRWDALP